MTIVPWTPTESAGTLNQVVEALRTGRLVGLPTDSVYQVAACALVPDAVERLCRLAEGERPALALAFPVEVFDWLPYLTGVGLRLARRFWPGPFTLIAGAGLDQGVSVHLPAAVRGALSPDQRMAFTIPDQAALRQVLHQLGRPVALASPARQASTAEELASLVGAETALIVDGGEALEPRPATVVRVEGRKAEVLREGAISADEVEAASRCRVVFVCTGNTCRSPMAQALCEKMLADWLGCATDELPRRGFQVESAGLAAVGGEVASADSAEVVRGLGGDLSKHRSRPLAYEMLAEADYVFAMTRSHLRVLYDLQLDVGPRPRLLSPEGDDVADPIGAPPEVYQECGRHIHGCLERIMPELLEN